MLTLHRSLQYHRLEAQVNAFVQSLLSFFLRSLFLL